MSLPRSCTAEDLAARLATWTGGVDVWDPEATGGATVAPSLAAAVAALGRTLAPTDQVLVTGSCFTVAEVLWTLGIRDLDATRTPRAAAPVLTSLAGP